MRTKVFAFIFILFACGMEVQAQYTFNYWALFGNNPTDNSNSFLGTTNNYPLIFKINNATQMCIDTTGFVGFGTTTPYHKIHVIDGNVMISKTHTRAPGSANGSLLFGDSLSTTCTHGAWGIEYVSTYAEGYGLNFWKPSTQCNSTKGNYFLFLADDGNVGIGTNNPQAKLAVNGEVLAKSVRVNATASYWPDYVFEKSYNLMNIKELEVYVQTCKHLPGIPSAQEIEQQQNVDLGEMNTLLLQKIEEMTLYIIQLEKRVSELENK